MLDNYDGDPKVLQEFSRLKSQQADMRKYACLIQVELDALMDSREEEMWGREGAFTSNEVLFELSHQNRESTKGNRWWKMTKALKEEGV